MIRQEIEAKKHYPAVVPEKLAFSVTLIGRPVTPEVPMPKKT